MKLFRFWTVIILQTGLNSRFSTYKVEAICRNRRLLPVVITAIQSGQPALPDPVKTWPVPYSCAKKLQQGTENDLMRWQIENSVNRRPRGSYSKPTARDGLCQDLEDGIVHQGVCRQV